MVFDFLPSMNQIPKPEKIIKIEWKKNDCDIVVVACSATESTRGSVVVRNGFMAFKYRKLGNGKKLESSLVTISNEPIINIAHRKINPLRVLVSDLLNF